MQTPQKDDPQGYAAALFRAYSNPKPKKTNPFRISVDKTLANAGHDLESFIESGAALDSIVPACCSDGCEVEPDGRCEHGCPAVTVALGVI